MECSLPGSSHGIFKARVLEWVAISFSRGSSRPRDWTQVFQIPGRYFTVWATKEDAKSWLIWKDPEAGKEWRWEEKVMTEDEMVGWHHRLNGHGSGWTSGVGDGQGGLACPGPWGRSWTRLSDWTELSWAYSSYNSQSNLINSKSCDSSHHNLFTQNKRWSPFNGIQDSTWSGIIKPKTSTLKTCIITSAWNILPQTSDHLLLHLF